MSSLGNPKTYNEAKQNESHGSLLRRYRTYVTEHLPQEFQKQKKITEAQT